MSIVTLSEALLQRPMKSNRTWTEYELHCLEHGKLIEALSEGARIFLDTQCCKKLEPHLEKVRALFKAHRETAHSEVLR